MIFAKHAAQVTTTTAPQRLRLPQPFIFNGQVCWSNQDLIHMENQINLNNSQSPDSEHTPQLH